MKTDIRTRSRILVLVAGAVTALIIGAPPAGARPSGLPGPGTCNYPGTGGHYGLGRLGVEFCDYPPVSHGQHYHCEWAGMPRANEGGCSWRWHNNGPAPTPPADEIFW